jgi:nanoRNase/pAp phosphatase (c-di-AMP/oligoRNAs hydrolase)
MDLTPKQQTSEAIRQSETILVTTGQHPSVDQVAATVALSMILRKFGKKVSAVITDNLPTSTQLLDTSTVERDMLGLRDFILKLDVSKAEVDKLRYEVIDHKLNVFVTPYGDAQLEYDLAIVLGVPTRARIDRIYEQNLPLFERIPVINLDFHRSNENYGAVNLIEPTASSLCEMLVALSESLQGGIIDAEIASALLMGIVASTDRFTAAHTTSKSLTVAAQMMAAGARQQAVVKALFRDGKGGNQNERSSERGNDRSNDRNGDRGNQPAQREPRAERQPQPQAQPESQRQPEPARQPEPQPQMQAPYAPEPMPDPAMMPIPAEQPMSAMPPAERPMPIIDPGHIELTNPSPEAAPSGSSMPTMPPMGDFAAAADILAQHPEDEQR